MNTMACVILRTMLTPLIVKQVLMTTSYFVSASAVVVDPVAGHRHLRHVPAKRDVEARDVTAKLLAAKSGNDNPAGASS